jgi:hypothetical protein
VLCVVCLRWRSRLIRTLISKMTRKILCLLSFWARRMPYFERLMHSKYHTASSIVLCINSATSLMPLIFMTYVLQYLDKVTLGSTAVMGIQADTLLYEQQYSWCSSAFYFGFLIASFPGSIGFVNSQSANTSPQLSSVGPSSLYAMAQHQISLLYSSLDFSSVY